MLTCRGSVYYITSRRIVGVDIKVTTVRFKKAAQISAKFWQRKLDSFHLSPQCRPPGAFFEWVSGN